jgi:hypothetical protein
MAASFPGALEPFSSRQLLMCEPLATISGSNTGMNGLLQRARARRDHVWAPRRMSDYLDGELGMRGQRRLERHVGECDECRGVLRGLQRMLSKLHDITAPAGHPDPRELAAQVRERLSAQDPKG